jgi:nucleoside-diphosphate-sugar epimerase
MGDVLQLEIADLKVAITGADGFIGKALASYLRQLGVQLYEITRNSSPCVNLLDSQSMESFIADVQPTTTVHLAYRKSFSGEKKDQINANLENKQMSKNLIAAIVNSKTHLIQIGSCAEYGRIGLPYRESAIPEPVSLYGTGKLDTTNALRAISANFPISWTVLRPSVVFGPGQSSDMFIPSIINAMTTKTSIELTSCLQNRDFIYIADIVEGIVAAMINRDNAAGRVINLASGKSHMLIDVATKIAKYFDVSLLENLKFGLLPMRDDEVFDYRVSIGDAEKYLMWRPKIGLDLGLSKTILGNSFIEDSLRA